MSVGDRILAGLRTIILVEEKIRDLESLSKSVNQTLLDHEKRLIRLETMIEIARAGQTLKIAPPARET